MKKKIILALLIAALLAGGAFAEGFSLSAGGGLLFDLSGNNGIKAGDSYIGTRNLSVGAYGFFDATYAEVDVSFAYGRITDVLENPSSSRNAGNAMQLGFSLLGKYPIDLSGFTLFPLLGLDYNLVLSRKDAGVSDPNPGNWNQLGFLAGVGVDYDLTDSLYIRAEGMFHLRLANKYMKDAADLSDASTTLGMGPRIKIGMGYKF